MTLNLGYLIGTGIFSVLLVSGAQRSNRCQALSRFSVLGRDHRDHHVGTTLADFVDRSLGIGYLGGSSLLFVLVLAALGVWYRVCGSVSVESVTTPRVELFYWLTILFSQTLGTALGDWMADNTGLGYEGGALVFAARTGGGHAGLLFYQSVTHGLVLGGFI